MNLLIIFGGLFISKIKIVEMIKFYYYIKMIMRLIYRKEINKLNSIFLYKNPMIQKLFENLE